MRAGMRGLAAVAAGLATAVVSAPAASAGTYDVVSCGAPGAGGVNRAWVPEFTSWPTTQPDPSSYRLFDQCPNQLFVSPAPPSGNARLLTGAQWSFTAPAGARLTRLETWRFGVKLRTGSTDPGGDTWDISARDEGNNVIGGVFGETCSTKPGDIGCQFGKDEGMGSGSRAVYSINAAAIRYQVSCAYESGCPRWYDDTTTIFPIASIKLFGTRVTITDPTRPSLQAGGSLLAGGWRRPSDTVTYNASDNTGIRATRLEIAGRTQRAPRACDYRAVVPCGNPRQATIGLPAGVPDGQYTARVVAEDAAGNETATERAVSVDGTPPSAGLERARGRSIVISVTDAASGVEGATLEVRRNSATPYRTVPAQVANGRLTARLGRGASASRLDMRVTVRDVAGNVTQGNPTRLSVTSAQYGRHTRRVRSNRVKVPFGRRATLHGRLTLSAGQSFAGQTIAVTSTIRRHGAHAQPAGTVTTNRHGRFSLRVPAGPSRTLRFVYGGAGGALGVARGISYRVPASSTIHASRSRLIGAARVRFSGRLRSRGQRIPARGLVLVLQGRERGRWRTFDDTRTDGRGRWHATYAFSGRPGRYPIRARIRRQSGYPFELGYSRALVVRVG